jgi:hypothetical protein
LPDVGKVLVTGMSGTGKSLALVELGRRGFRVVDTDLPGWSEWVPGAGDSDGEWLWREDRIASLLATANSDLFLSGCVANQGKFYGHFDAIVLMSASVDVMLDRIESRTTNDYGKGPGERERILADLAQVEPLLRATGTHEVDASRPLSEVVDALMTIAETVDCVDQ